MRKIRRDSLPEGISLVREDGSPYEPPEGMRLKMETTEETGRDVIRGGYFGKLWKEGREEIGKLETMEIAFLIRVIGYLNYEDNTIRRNGEVMNIKEMAEATGVSRGRLSEWVDDLIKRRIMGEHKTEILEGYKGRRKKVYSINPYVYCEGVTVAKGISSYYRRGEDIERKKRGKMQ